MLEARANWTLEERIGDHPFVGEIRGVGMPNAVEFVADKATRRPFRPERERIGSWRPRRG